MGEGEVVIGEGDEGREGLWQKVSETAWREVLETDVQAYSAIPYSYSFSRPSLTRSPSSLIIAMTSVVGWNSSWLMPSKILRKKGCTLVGSCEEW